MKKSIIFFTIFLLVLAAAFAQEIPNYQDKYVNDFAHILSISQATELKTLFAAVDQNTTAEITLLTVETVSPTDMSSYAQEVFDKWKIGKVDKDNGLLILYANDTRKIWVQTGYGLEGILPDSKIGRILDETFVPARANNNTAEGIVLAAREYADVITANADEVRSGTAGPKPIDPLILIAIFVLLPLLLVALIAFVIYNYKHPKCPCGGRADAIKTETCSEKNTGAFGMERTTQYTVVTYKCRKCGKTSTKKRKGQYRNAGGGLILIGGGRFGGGGFGGGGFGGGGFGGGGSGGGGAGR